MMDLIGWYGHSDARLHIERLVIAQINCCGPGADPNEESNYAGQSHRFYASKQNNINYQLLYYQFVQVELLTCTICAHIPFTH